MGDEPLPTSLTLDQAFRAAYFLTKQYVELEREPDVGLVLYEQYLHSDPAPGTTGGRPCGGRSPTMDRPIRSPKTSTGASRSQRAHLRR